MPVKRVRPRGLKTQKGRHTGEVRAGRRSCPDNGFAHLQEWTDGGSVLASPCGRPARRRDSASNTAEGPTTSPTTSPQRLVRFREVSRMPWAGIARRLGAGPKTVRRWHKHGVRPNAHYLLALQDLAKSRGLGHLFTVRATPYQTAESEGRGESGQGPADRTTGGVQNAGRPGHSLGRGTPAVPPKDQRCYAQSAHTPQHR